MLIHLNCCFTPEDKTVRGSHTERAAPRRAAPRLEQPEVSHTRRAQFMLINDLKCVVTVCPGEFSRLQPTTVNVITTDNCYIGLYVIFCVCKNVSREI